MLELLIILMLAALAILMIVIFLARQFKREQIWRPFTLLLSLCSGWTALYTVTTFQSTQLQEVLVPLQFVFVILLIPLTLVMIVMFTGKWNDAWRRWWPLLFIYPAINILFAVTDPWNHLFIQSFVSYQYGGFTLLAFQPGILMWGHLAFSYVLFIIGTLLLVQNIRMATGIYRMRGTLLLLGMILPVAGDMLFYSQFNPFPGATLTPALFAITGSLYWFAIFNYGLFDMMPVARDALWDSSPDAVFVLDGKGRIMDFNHSAELTFGWARKELVGSLADPQSIPDRSLAELFASPKRTMQTYESEDGRIFQGRGTDLLDKKGAVIGRLVLLSDVTAEMKARKDAEQRQALLTKIMEEAPFAITITDPETGWPLFINSRTEDLLKVRVDQKDQHRSTSFYVNQSDRTRIIQTIREKGEAKDFETYLQDSQGKRFWAYMNGSLINIDGKEWLFVSIHDISELKLVDELRKTNRKLNLLSSITRHDLWNKYMAMTGYLELLREMTWNEDAKAMINKLNASALEAQRLINFTSYYDKLGGNPPSWYAIGDIVRKAESQLDLDGVVVHVENGGVQIYADPMVERAIYNLMDDSVRHGKTVKNIWIRPRKEGDELLVVYEDDGQGIDKDIRPYLFQRGRGKNTGLGLFLAREILDITGIQISEQGEPDKGARFILKVPPGRFNSWDAKP